MARGWESKSVEEQQSQLSTNDVVYPQLSPEEKARNREQEALRLARARIQQQLEAATDERYKKQLQAALDDLEKKASR